MDDKDVPRDRFGFPILVWRLSDKPYRVEVK